MPVQPDTRVRGRRHRRRGRIPGVGLTCSIGLFLSAAAHSQPQPVEPGFPSSTPQGPVAHPPPELRGSSLIEAEVTHPAGRGVGTITDFAFDAHGGAIRYVVVGVDRSSACRSSR